MIIRYKDLCATDFIFSDAVAYRLKEKDNTIYNYEANGRFKHLLFYQLENTREYYIGDRLICTLTPGNILFLPHGAKYRSILQNPGLESDGIGISFNLSTPDGAPIFIDEDIKILCNDPDGKHLKIFTSILSSLMNPIRNTVKLKGDVYTLLDSLFSDKENREDFKKNYGDIIAAINILENSPEKNLSTKMLADICFMSESSFMRKFKRYSGGISPIKYRNNIRLMLAEELAASPLTTNEIAEQLGFYDGAHLCKVYKHEKGKTLKRNITVKL